MKPSWLCRLAVAGAVYWAPWAARARLVPLAPGALLERVQRAYARGGDFEAAFTQTYVDAFSGRSRAEAGHMWVKVDGRVRFAYTQPEAKDFVFDGNTAYFYEPENAQVTVFEHFAASPVAQAMQFLWGQGTLAQLFTADVCPPAAKNPALCPAGKAGEQVLYLQPRQPLPTVEHMALTIDTKAAQVRRCVVYDALQNETRYTFANVRFGKALAEARFAFTIPSGVSVLRAPDIGAAGASGARTSDAKVQ